MSPTCTNNLLSTHIHDQYNWIQCISSGETLTQSLTVSQDSPEAIPTLIPPRVFLYNRYNFGPPMAEDILHGTHAIDLSHAGHSGELSELVSEDMKKLR